MTAEEWHIWSVQQELRYPAAAPAWREMRAKVAGKIQPYGSQSSAMAQLAAAQRAATNIYPRVCYGKADHGGIGRALGLF